MTDIRRLGHYGNPTPIGGQKESANVGGTEWQLWYGTNGPQQTYSFVASSPINTWSGDIKQFFDYLTQHHQFPADSQFLISTFISPSA